MLAAEAAKQEYYKYTKVRLVVTYKEHRKPEEYFFLLFFFRLLGGTIVRITNITIFAYFPAQRFKGKFSFDIA